MFQVVLADDEPQILQGMQRGMDWGKYGFEVVGTAANGEEAFELVQSLRPDVLISDIKMPFMDGLHLVQKLAEEFIQVKVILFSGFDDFEYAQTAIRYGVTDYLLKPINTSQMGELLNRLRQTLEQEYKERSDRERLLQLHRENLPVLREQFLARLAEGKVPAEKIERAVQEYGLQLPGPVYTAVTMQADPLANEEETDEALLQLPVSKMVTELLQQVYSATAFRHNDQIYMIVSLPAQSELDSVLKALSEAELLCERYLKIGFFCGVGGCCGQLCALCASFQEAGQALEYSVLSKDDRILSIRDVQPQTPPDTYYFEDGYASELETAIRLGQTEDIERIINKLFARLDSLSLKYRQYQICVLEMVFTLGKMIHQYQLDKDQVFTEAEKTVYRIFSIQTGERLKLWLYNYCCYIGSAIRQKRLDTNAILARQAKEYVDANYSDPALSVEVMCAQLHVSASHFSNIFKKENGVSFVSYLTQKRLDEAARLLETTDEKSRVIGEMVGYPEPNYFSYVFKKYRKVSPANFRKMKAQGDKHVEQNSQPL